MYLAHYSFVPVIIHVIKAVSLSNSSCKPYYNCTAKFLVADLGHMCFLLSSCVFLILNACHLPLTFLPSINNHLDTHVSTRQVIETPPIMEDLQLVCSTPSNFGTFFCYMLHCQCLKVIPVKLKRFNYVLIMI